MELVAYLRVSTDTQLEGYGLDVQREEIEQWATANGHRILRWHTDAGESGSNGLETRLALADALRDVGRGDVAGVVVPRLDRLARDLVTQEQLMGEIWRSGGQIYSTKGGEANCCHPDDPDDPSRELIRQVLGAVAAYERKMIRLRLRRGRQAKAARGGYAGGRPPYGWRAERKQLVPVEEEQHVLALMREMRERSWPIRRIVEELNAAGHTAQTGGRWHFEQVRRALNQNIGSASPSTL